MLAGLPRFRTLILFALVAVTAGLVPACGGGGGGAGPDGAGQGLVLMSFLQGGQDNLPINRVLEFRFSEPVDQATITTGTIQIREGPAYGLTVKGEFIVDGAVVWFKPVLPSTCDNSDSGLKPGTTYRVTVMGHPEEFSVKNAKGQALDATVAAEFATRPESDPEYLEDQIPGVAPAVVDRTPSISEAGVTVAQGNEVLLTFTENLDPCTVTESTVSLWMYELGEASLFSAIPDGEPNAGNKTGFDPFSDSLPDDPLSWGGNATALLQPQRVPSEVVLTQSYETTALTVVPSAGVFPENALIVVKLTFEIRDFGGTPLPPEVFSFTTENLQKQTAEMVVNYDTSTEGWPLATRTADIDSARSPGVGQGWLLFAGGGDNGTNDLQPLWPQFDPFDCSEQAALDKKDGTKDHFDPEDNVTLDTGSTRVPDSCANTVDGSTGVVWEFASFRIRSGVTVTIVGENPAIILVQGEVIIEGGGTLRCNGGKGGNGATYSTGSMQPGKGGLGYGGAGDGGKGGTPGVGSYGIDGWAGYGSEDYDTAEEQGGLGAGEGNSAATTGSYGQPYGSSAAGGGGGHGTAGSDGQAQLTAGYTWKASPRGAGGDVYPTTGSPEELYVPSAGSGGGGSGWVQPTGYSGYQFYDAAGGGGGAGGGFLDLTSQANIRIYGTISAVGGVGGTGGGAYYWGAGGGGGGSGGAIRLLTPAKIDVTNGKITAVGGAGGACGSGQYGTVTLQNRGGAGGLGYIAMESGDTLIDGFLDSDITPGEGTDQFYRGEFQASRFQGGGLSSTAASEPIFVGTLAAPEFLVQTAADFDCAIPAEAARQPTGTGIVLEASGLPMLPDGSPDTSVPDQWYTLGYFSYSGTPDQPAWHPGANPPDATLGDNNVGVGITNLNGSQFLKIRVSFFLPDTVGASTPGPWINWMKVPFSSDQ